MIAPAAAKPYQPIPDPPRQVSSTDWPKWRQKMLVYCTKSAECRGRPSRKSHELPELLASLIRTFRGRAVGALRQFYCNLYSFTGSAWERTAREALPRNGHS